TTVLPGRRERCQARRDRGPEVPKASLAVTDQDDLPAVRTEACRLNPARVWEQRRRGVSGGRGAHARAGTLQRHAALARSVRAADPPVVLPEALEDFPRPRLQDCRYVTHARTEQPPVRQEGPPTVVLVTLHPPRGQRLPAVRGRRHFGKDVG